jgi:hypothetical protein
MQVRQLIVPCSFSNLNGHDSFICIYLVGAAWVIWLA